MIDLLASNYHDLGYIMELDYDTGFLLIEKARKKDLETKRWQLYCNVYPNFTKETFIPFDAFNQQQNKIIILKPKEQIHQETNKLKELFAKGK